MRKNAQKKYRPLREKCRKNTRCPLPFRLRRRASVAPFRAGNAGPRGILARPVGRHRENAPRSWKAFFPRHRVSKSVGISVTQLRRLLTIFCRKLIFGQNIFLPGIVFFLRFQYWIIKEKPAFSGNEICHADSQSPPRFFGQKNRNFGNSISENDHFKKFSVVSFDFWLVVTTDFFSRFFIGELGFFYWRILGFFRRQCATAWCPQSAYLKYISCT